MGELALGGRAVLVGQLLPTTDKPFEVGVAVTVVLLGEPPLELGHAIAHPGVGMGPTERAQLIDPELAAAELLGDVGQSSADLGGLGPGGGFAVRKLGVVAHHGLGRSVAVGREGPGAIDAVEGRHRGSIGPTT